MEETRKIAGWSTKMLEKNACMQEFEDTQEMRQWRNISPEGIDEMWKELCGKIEEEVRRSTRCGRRNQERC